MKKNYDELFRDIVTILRRDYAGAEQMGGRFDPRYYNMSIGQAWRDRALDELLFFRYVNQMLACVGDRRLRLTMRPSEAYRPWCCGFFTRRYGDSLYVTALRGEARLSPGDRIAAVNGGTPSHHRRRIQKNFFYADEPEREDWNGFLKMADTIDIVRADGSAERLELRRHPLRPPEAVPRLHTLPEGAALDLRNVPDLTEDALTSLLPAVCRRDTPLSALLDTEFFVNYTALNCELRAACFAGAEGGEPYLRELREKAGKGFLPERDDDDAVVPGKAAGDVVVLTDTWTRDGAETLALAAKRAGAVLMGRPTLGTIDGGGDVSLALDERYILTWPTLITRDAREGRGTAGRGVPPDIYIPWTPEECRRDLLMEAAVRHLTGKTQEIHTC